MIDREHELPVMRQCALLELARSTAYYQRLPLPEADLVLMRRLDELHRGRFWQRAGFVI